MSTLMVLEQRKHDLRQDLVHTAKTYGKAARETQKVFHKLRQIQSEIVATEMYFGVKHDLRRT